MGFGMSFKLAPGVRVRTSRRGIRTSLGPRAARIHVGGGRTTVSTGAGPFTFWTGLGGGQPRRPAGRSQVLRSEVSLAALERQSAATERGDSIQTVMRLEQSLLTLHLEDFPQA